MRIEQLGAYGYGVQVAKAKRREQADDEGEKKSKARFSRKDSYEPSGAVEASKADSVKEIKKRVKSNFYNSEAVDEDLSEVFTKLFNR